MDELLHNATLMWPQAGGLCGAGLLGGSLACQAGGGVGVIGGVEARRGDARVLAVLLHSSIARRLSQQT